MKIEYNDQRMFSNMCSYLKKEEDCFLALSYIQRIVDIFYRKQNCEPHPFIRNNSILRCHQEKWSVKMPGFGS